jgi:hypothetical protein
VSDPDPAECDPAGRPPRPLLGLWFWLILAISLACVLAGLGVATLGPRL